MSISVAFYYSKSVSCLSFVQPFISPIYVTRSFSHIVDLVGRKKIRD